MKRSKDIYHLPFTIYHLVTLLYGVAGTLLLSSCYQPDVVMHTTIHNRLWKGATREVSYKNVMSKEMRDSLWGKDRIEWSRPMPECLNIDAFCQSHTEIGEGDTVTTTFTCPFSSVEEMCQQTPLQLNGTRLRSNAKLEKRFRWFYTEYAYTEVFYCVGDTFKLAATDYADKDIVSFWFTGKPNLLEGLSGAEASQKLQGMDSFATKWLNDNLYQLCFDFIVSNYDSITTPPVNREGFIELRDSLLHFFLDDEDDILAIQPEEKLRDFFHSDAYTFFFDEDTPCGCIMNKELANRLNIFWFNVPYTLSMPGTVIDAGNGTLQPDGTIFYPFTGERLIPQDYTISAVSRVTHWWAYLLTLFIIALAMASILYGRRK